MTWAATNLINLNGGNWIKFDDYQKLNGKQKAVIKVTVRRGSNGWFPNTRQLLYRQNQIRIQAQGVGNLINVGVHPQGNTTPVMRGIPDSPAIREKLIGKAAHIIVVIYDGTKPAEQRIRIFVDGIEFATTGTGTVPSSIPTITGKDLYLGFTDLLQQSVGDLAFWTDWAPTDEQAVGLWNRYKIADLTTGIVTGPHGEAIDVPVPLDWCPCSDDVLPDVSPRIGTLQGTVLRATLPSTATKDPKVPISPVVEADAVASRRIRIKNLGTEGEDSQPYVGFCAIERLPDGSIFIAYSRCSGHDSPDADIWVQKITNGGSAFAWPQGQQWPLDQARGVCVLDTTETARGNALKTLSTGRLIHACNYSYATANPTPPPAGPIPEPGMTAFRLISDSDDSAGSWVGDPVLGTRWRYLWPGFHIGMPVSAQFVENGCGTVFVCGYRKPNPTVTYRNLELIKSGDGCRNWSGGPIVHDGSVDGFMWEEGQIGWLSRGHQTMPGGAGWACVGRVDHAAGAKLYIKFAVGEDLHTAVWGPFQFLIDGYNDPVWREMPPLNGAPGYVVLLTSDPPIPGNPPNLDGSKSMMHIFTDGFASLISSTWLGTGNDRANMGNGMIVNDDGTPKIIVAHAQLGVPYSGATVCEVIDAIKTW